MPQGRRKLPFSGKQKKQQIQEKRKRKQLNAASGMLSFSRYNNRFISYFVKLMYIFCIFQDLNMVMKELKGIIKNRPKNDCLNSIYKI